MHQDPDPLASSRRLPLARPGAIEWPTLFMLAACIGLWSVGMWAVAAWSPGLAIVPVTLALILHSSLTHEVLHGHPFPSRRASEALVLINPGIAIPYLRFRDQHLAHHHDARLTDPYDDPESNYLDPKVWQRLPVALRGVLVFNNTLLGRMLAGPAIGQVRFMAEDLRLGLAGDRQVRKGWLLHLPGVAIVLWLVWLSPMPFWAYAVACYLALSVLKIRTFLEHQAHERARARTVVIEDRGPLALLFLNNNLHVVHHMHPRVPWYRLPALYRNSRDRYLKRNDGYRYRSYAEVFRHHFLRAKDPVPHPLWPGR